MTEAEEKAFTWDEIEVANGHTGKYEVNLLSACELEELRKRLHQALERKAPLLGIYNDLGPARSIEYASAITDLGLDEDAIMVERSRAGFDPVWNVDQLKQYHEKSLSRQKTQVVWPEPTTKWFREFERRMPKLLSAVPTFALDFDSEMRMKESFVDGFADLDAFGATLMELARSWKRDGLIREIQVDTFPGHREAHGADGLDGEDMFYLQTYPIYKEGRSYTGRFGPQNRVRKDFDFVRAKGMDEPLSAVLPLWGMWRWGQVDLAFADMTDSALSRPYERYRFWSLKHAVGPKANTYAARMVKRMAARIRAERA